MARTVRDANLESRTARSRLARRGKPYYRLLEAGLHLGYRKPASGAGKWVVRYYVGNGAYAVETIATADDDSDSNGADVLSFAEAQREARKGRDARSRSAAGLSGPYTVADTTDAYLTFLADDGRSEEAVKDAAYRINAFVLPTLGKIEVAALTAERLRQWRDGLSKSQPRVRSKKGETNHNDKPHDGRARKASANRTFTTLRAALNSAFRAGKVPSDAEWRKVENFENVETARLRYLTVAEAKRFINACPPDFRRLVQAALMTGARYGELGRLTVADFNPDAGTVAIHRSKTGKPRHVMLTNEGKTFFRQLTAGRPGDEPMLPRDDGETWRKSDQNLPMAAAVARAKIAPPITFHGLRHTWASHAVMNGVPLMVVAKNLGHVSTAMVEKHYGHLAQSFMTDAIRDGAPRFGVKASNVVQIRAKG